MNTTKIALWLQQGKAIIKISQLEKKASIPASTLKQVISGKRKLSPAQAFAVSHIMNRFIGDYLRITEDFENVERTILNMRDYLANE